MIIQPMSESVTTRPALVASQGIAPLPHLGVIRAKGEDAASFLQGQLTQDVVLMQPGEARLAAFCNAKGRMLASFQVLKTAPDELLLVTSADTLPATLKRLSMFVLRAKLKLSDATGDFERWGQLGETPDSIAACDYPAGAEGQNDAQACAHRIPLPPADGAPRTLWLAPTGSALPADVPALAPADWLLAEVRSGVARITQPVVEAFVPQMLNYESVGGVNFKKGCYPGQEVVARSQFRGAIKRRAYLAHAPAGVAVGARVFADGDAEQPVGTVVQAAAAPAGGVDALVSLQIAAADGVLHAGAADGVPLTLQPLPYALLEDI